MISFLFFLFCIEPLPNLLLVEHFLTTSGLTMLDSNLFLLKWTLKILICLSLSFNKIYIWFSKCSWHRVPKIPGISKMIRVINVCFFMLMKWLLDLTEVQELVSCQEHHNHLIRGLKLSVPPPRPQRRKVGLEDESTANCQWFNQLCLCDEAPTKPPEVGVWRASRSVNIGEWCPGGGM